MHENALEKYWKTVVNTIRDGIMIVDKQGNIVTVNKAFEKIIGFPKKELVGASCAILNCSIYDDARRNGKGHWCGLFRTGKMDHRKCTIRQKTGSHIHVLKNAALLYDGDGEVLGAVESITDITEIIKRDHQIAAFRRELKSEDSFHGLLGKSAPMQKVFDLITNASQSDAHVIIFGESGSGKELVAKAIHNLSRRKQKPFVKVNCAALTESLLESELFGHVKGAYTGAYKNRAGRFEMANQGSILLDEIGDLPLSMQIKLLRVLEEKVIERVGDNKPIPVDVRVISATNRNLHRLIREGKFRKDFFFRINVIPLYLPPLRERADDISLLAGSFFRKTRLKSGKNIKEISPEAMEILVQYQWPGNVREMKSAFEYAFVTCNQSVIRPEHLPPHVLHNKDVHVSDKKIEMRHAANKKRALIAALERTGGNQSKAARLLGISRVTVWNRIKKYNISLTPKISA